ncbi:hypothetical protein [Catenuloplanes atrovinosus]|uniref:Fe2+ transport system protein FeoA n=1 Tax=Catenuloplanes atrovinosus TaxID=137266 RepID=A0AAE3YTV4_9ACTN|nr:hypothetical protein [Catenuloplanes atrovinosus]MDR7277791.1 Fe2+ transport system protein FeoA [Catenuloplanes atrovinosus]
MDFADVGRIILRRWPVTAPLMLLTVAAVAWAMFGVPQQAKVTGHVTLLPQREQYSPAIGDTVTTNPWNPVTLADVITVRLDSPRLAEDLYERGYRGEWTVTVINTGAAIIAIEVLADTEAEARRVIDVMDGLIGEEVVARQQSLGLTEGAKITVVPLAGADAVERDNSRRRRIAVVAGGAGAVVTVSAAALAEWLSRRRRRAADPS